MWYHVSDKYIGEEVRMKPKEPLSSYEIEGDIPRICVSDSIFRCLRAKRGNTHFDLQDFLFILTQKEKIEKSHICVKNLAVYCANEDAEPYQPPLVCDFRKNHEHWFLQPTDFTFMGYINSQKFIDGALVLCERARMYIDFDMRELEQRFDGRSYRTIQKERRTR